MNHSNGFQKKCLNSCLIALLSLTTGKEEPKATVQKFSKVGLSPSKKFVFICFNDSHSKMKKNAFYLS